MMMRRPSEPDAVRQLLVVSSHEQGLNRRSPCHSAAMPQCPVNARKGISRSEKTMLLKSALVALGAAALIAAPAAVSAHPAGYGDNYVVPYRQNTYGAYSSGYAYGSYGSPQGYGYSGDGNRWAAQAYDGSNRGWSGYSRYGPRRDYGYGGYQDQRDYRGRGHHHHHDDERHHAYYDRD